MAALPDLERAARGRLGRGAHERLAEGSAEALRQRLEVVLLDGEVHQLVRLEDFARDVKWWPIWLGALVVGAGGLGVFSQRKLRAQASFGFGVPVIYVGLAMILWITGSLWLPLVWPDRRLPGPGEAELLVGDVGDGPPGRCSYRAAASSGPKPGVARI